MAILRLHNVADVEAVLTGNIDAIEAATRPMRYT